MPLGQCASQAPVFVQFPNPSLSICFTIFKTRSLASTLPCGNLEYCETFAPTNNIADEFLHEATHAPQPIQAAALKASSASGFGIGVAFASTVFPEVFTET